MSCYNNDKHKDVSETQQNEKEIITMNNDRRKILNDIRNNLEAQRDKLESVVNDEQMAFDNLTEGLQATMRGEAMEEAIDNMESAIEAIDEAIEYIDEASM